MWTWEFEFFAWLLFFVVLLAVGAYCGSRCWVRGEAAHTVIKKLEQTGITTLKVAAVVAAVMFVIYILPWWVWIAITTGAVAFLIYIVIGLKDAALTR